MASLHVQVHPPPPSSDNQTHHNRPSRLLGFHTFAGIHLGARYDRVISCCGFGLTVETIDLSDLSAFVVSSQKSYPVRISEH